MFFAIFNCVFVPLQVSFDSDSLNSTSFLVINTTIDICFFVDMIISFRTVYIDGRGRLISDDKKMAINYLQTSFLADILATVPFDTILRAFSYYRVYKEELKRNGDVPWIDLLGLFKLGRLLRLNDIIYFLKTTDDVKSSLKLVKLILYLVVYAHCFACLWWFTVKSDKQWIPAIDIPSG